MDFINLIIAILLIGVGILLIDLYYDRKKEKKTDGLSFKIRTAGIGCVLIGIALIIREIT